jgi:radical SAM protein with 4Fe4S-binding SPASM domain
MLGTIHVVRNVDDSWASGFDRAEHYARYCTQLERDFESMFEELENPRYSIQLPRWMEVAELSFEAPAPDICCGIGSDHIVIKHDGSLASCPMTVHERTVVPVDDLFEAALQTFTASPMDRPADDVCLSCQWYKVCASACPVANERIKGKPFTQSPLCRFWKYVIPRYLDFYGKKLIQSRDQPLVWNGVEPRVFTERALTTA